MANIFTYSIFTAADIGLTGSGSSRQITVPTSAPTLQLHLTDDDNNFESQLDESGTTPSTSQLGWVFDPTSGYSTTLAGIETYIDNVITFDVGGGNTVDVYEIFLDSGSGGQTFYILSEPDVTAFGGSTGTNPSDDFFPSGLTYDDVPTWDETLTGQTGGPNLGGDDSIQGFEGDDSLRGLSDDDTIDGGEGDDSIDGGSDDDSILGGSGNDSLIGAENNDTVLGGADDDIVYGDGSDVRNPAQDAANFNFNRSNVDVTGSSAPGGVGAESAGDFITYENVATTAGGQAIDARFVLVDVTEADGVTASSMPVDLNNSDTTDPNIVILNLGATTTAAGSTFAGHQARIRVEFYLSGTETAVTVNGTFTFLDLDETTSGGATTDREKITVSTTEFTNYTVTDTTNLLIEDNGSSFSFSGTQNNNQNTQTDEQEQNSQVNLDFTNRSSFEITLTSRNVNSGFTFDTSNFTVATTSENISDEGDDSVDGGAGNDTLFGSAGRDTLSGGTGDDVIDGGADPDLILLEDDFGADSIDGGAQGGDQDTLSAIDVTGEGIDVVLNDFNSGTVVGRTTGGTAASFDEIEVFIATEQDDTFDSTAVTQGTEINTESGSDTITAGSGDDTINADSTLAGPSSASGNDVVDAGGGDDVITTGDGADTITGGTGNDDITAGGGNDTILLTDLFGTDTISGGGGSDTLDASGLTSHGVTIEYTGNQNGTVSDQTNAAGSFTSVRNLILSDQDDIVDAEASLSSQTLDGRDGDDSLTGGGNRDNISGGEGNDTLRGGVTNSETRIDTLDGGAGADLIFYGSREQIAGGTGSDTIEFEDDGQTGGVIIDGGEDADDSDIDVLRLDGTGLRRGDVTFTSADEEDGFFIVNEGAADEYTVTFSNIESVVCFASETRVLTPLGLRRVDALRIGDLVVTRDSGLQAIRWIARKEVPAVGALAPVEIAAGRLGNTTPLRVSPQHRILMRDGGLRLSHGSDEMLIAARHLVDGGGVHLRPGGTVEYVHLMFARHEIVFAEGIEAESFHPGEMSLGRIADAAREELFGLFPELRVFGAAAYGPSARKTLRAREWAAPLATHA